MPKAQSTTKATVTRQHRFILKPLGFRVDAAYRATHPPLARTRACARCGLTQDAAPPTHGAHIAWPKCEACPGRTTPDRE